LFKWGLGVKFPPKFSCRFKNPFKKLPPRTVFEWSVCKTAHESKAVYNLTKPVLFLLYSLLNSYYI
jgi:hypothetical protein